MLEQRTALERALERMYKSFYPYWLTIKELRQAEDPQALLAEWQRARKPSQAWRKAHFYHEAIGVLCFGLGLPREDTERLVAEYVGATQAREVGS